MRSVVLFCLMLSSAALSPLQAQPAPGSPAAVQALSPAQVREVVGEVIEAVRKDYVDTQNTAALVRLLEQGLASGRYATPNQEVLATRITEDLRKGSNDDGHMYLTFRPDLLRARARAPSANGPSPSMLASFERERTLTNSGVTELLVLPGNVRYVKISRWFWDPNKETEAAMAAAMQFLRGGDAMIIDVKDNGGGAAAGVQFIASHFLDPGTKMMTFLDGPSQREVVTSRAVPGGKIVGKPLMLVVGPGSASASEELAAHVKYFKLGKLVGEKTAGAGNPNSLYPLSHGFELSISTGRALHAVTGEGWEKTGIAPDVRAALPAAAEVAHLEALKTLLASASPERRGPLEWAIAALSGTGQSSLSAAERQALVGAYEGAREIAMRDGTLFWKRADRPELAMIPLGGRVFALGDRFGPRLQPAADGAGVEVTRPGSPPEIIRRNP